MSLLPDRATHRTEGSPQSAIASKGTACESKINPQKVGDCSLGSTRAEASCTCSSN